MTGTNGWYMHFPRGVSPVVELDLTLLPAQQSIIFATRYPAGTALTVTRDFKFFRGLSETLTRVPTQREVVHGDGTLYHFEGTTLTVKLVDPGTYSLGPMCVCVCVAKKNLIQNKIDSSLVEAKARSGEPRGLCACVVTKPRGKLAQR